MKNMRSIFTVFSLLSLILLSYCKEKEEPKTDFSQFVIGEWSLSESYTATRQEEILDECNRQTTYTFGTSGIMNINPRATAYDSNNNPYCLAVLNDGLGVDLEYSVVDDRFDSELGPANLEKVNEQTLRMMFDNEDLGVLVLVR